MPPTFELMSLSLARTLIYIMILPHQPHQIFWEPCVYRGFRLVGLMVGLMVGLAVEVMVGMKMPCPPVNKGISPVLVGVTVKFPEVSSKLSHS